MSVSIRQVTDADRPEWDVLYQGYADFYKVTQTPEMRDRVWRWINDPAQQTEARVAVDAAGKLIGLAHFRPFARPLAASVGGFLDDLFVSPDARGSGAAQALIEALKAEGAKRGWTVIRWITAEDNYRARTVYDRTADRTKWVTYDIKL